MNKVGLLHLLADLLIVICVVILSLTFGQATTKEIEYQTRSVFKITYPEKTLAPPDTDFSIVIPKIGAAAKVVENVNPADPKDYLPALYKGVAHAKGTASPGQFGNTYIFAHSTDAFYNVGRYNAVFYLLGKLNPGDEIDIYYKGEKIVYEVTDKKVVEAGDVKYLGKLGEWNTLTLQTCYPPGTTLKRLVVVANQVR
jgi:sortase A